MSNSDFIVRGEKLVKTFTSREGLFSKPKTVTAVDSVSVSIRKGETFAIVGESGSGKSTLGRMLLNLMTPTAGEVTFEGQAVNRMQGKALSEFRRDFQIIFQDPFSSLNPRMSVADIVGEPLWLEGRLSVGERRQRVQELLQLVGLRPDQADRYPHEFSGGQRQRIGIARAIAGSPKVILGDEPVSALDVSVQAQIINLLEDLKEKLGLTLIIVAHDLAVIRHMSDRVAVMYLGEIIELADVQDLYAEPLHPYTRALLEAVPAAQPSARQDRALVKGELALSGGQGGCKFASRCPFAKPICQTTAPKLLMAGSSRQIACHFWKEIAAEAPMTVKPDRTAPGLARKLEIYRERQARNAASAAQ
ncbi:oligopeptide/dipeptide ABC transporter ATP-binding protein [Rhizobium sp. 2MFCol3.1]|uniref:ABC transporter ATP-binding protein n=1 Tax=Rhizobium sp. 2MFCol3.1 TaxID=1246459 RepID=UPI00036C0EE7|nr:oligopeptide/dipeptide ABC transporter ATP-binding protein [Rhizobium sp. 2MFCol3.1]